MEVKYQMCNPNFIHNYSHLILYSLYILYTKRCTAFRVFPMRVNGENECEIPLMSIFQTTIIQFQMITVVPHLV